MADRLSALANIERALAELEDYAALPIANRRDKAGLIQGFEFTFELFWKLFMKLAPSAGIEAKSPREALMAGAQLRLIEDAEQPHWTQMLLDRNQTSHTYNANLADEILGRILSAYLPCFRATLVRARATNGALPPPPVAEDGRGSSSYWLWAEPWRSEWWHGARLPASPLSGQRRRGSARLSR